MSLVVFHTMGGHWMDPILHKDFKHCFVAVKDDHNWITLDSRMGLPTIRVVARSDYDLASFYANEGYPVVEVNAGRPSKLPLTLTNCVGMVKSVLGIQAFGVVTPYQLYRRLTK